MNQFSTEKTVPGLTNTRQTFLYILPLSALVFFTFRASLDRGSGSLLTVACGMLIFCVLFLALAGRWDKPSYIDWTVSAYFLLVLQFLALWPEFTAGILTEYAVAGAYLCLFSAAFFPSVFGLQPLSCHYAKKRTPPEFWSSPLFLTINRIITFTWAGIFATCVILSLYPSIVTRVLIPVVLIAGVGVPFSLRFPDYYLGRFGLPTLAEMGKSLLLSAKDTASVSDGAAVPRVAVTTSESVRPVLPLESSGLQSVTSDQLQPRGSGPMKVIAINSSPRGEGVSKTGMLLDALVTGMREAGADVEIVNLRQKVFRNCIGCFTCWSKTPGVCVHEDDMANELLPKWLEADMAVYATPLYHYTMNAAMKAFIERTLPIVEPFLQRHDGRTTHPLRQRIPEAVVLSVAGLPELSVFDPLSSYVKFLFGTRLVAEMYRPGAEAMTLPQLSEKVKDVFEATAQSGRELVQFAKISAVTTERVTQPFGDPDSLVKMANVFWTSCIRERLTPTEFHKRSLIPRPDSLETFMMIMLSGFSPEAAAKTKGTIQFTFLGEVEGACHFRIENGKIVAQEGAAENPDLMIESPFDVWMDIVTEKADGQQLFFQEKYKTDGNLSLLIRMKDLFGRRQQQRETHRSGEQGSVS